MVNSEKEKVNQLLALTIGELREKLAYTDAEDTVEDWLDWTELDNDAWEDEEEDCDCCEEDCEGYDEDSYWDEEDEDAYIDDEEEEEDDEDISLPYDEEVLAQDIAGDIVAGKYALEAIQGLYAPVFVDRVRQLADLEEE